jgi:hypothetical protein
MLAAEERYGRRNTSIYEDDNFWDIVPSSLVEVYRHFRGAYCFHHQDDDGGNTHEDQLDLTVVCPRML